MTHLLEGVELCTAVVEAAKRSLIDTQSADSLASARLRASRLLLAGAIGLEAFAIWPRNERSHRGSFSRGAEAAALPGWGSGKVLNRLKQQPAAIQRLTLFQSAVDAVLQSSMQVLPVAGTLVSAAAALSRQYPEPRNQLSDTTPSA